MSSNEKMARLEVLFHIWKLVKDLEYEVSFNGISEYTGAREAIWFRITLSGGRECLIAPITSESLMRSHMGEQEVLRLVPQSVIILREFINMFSHPDVESFGVMDFGFYSPASSKDIFAIRASSTRTKQNFHFLISELSDPEDYYSHIREEAIGTHFDGTMERMRAWVPLECVPQSDIFCAKNRVYFKTYRDAKAVLMECSLKSRNASTVLYLEEETMIDLDTLIPARLVLCDIEIGLDAYLSLSVGDEIQLTYDEDELPVTLEIGGVAIAQGCVRMEDGGLRFQVRQPSVGNIFHSLTNKVRTIPKEGGHHHDDKDSPIDSKLS